MPLRAQSGGRRAYGQGVYNEKNEKIGSVDDLNVSPDKALSSAIIGAGGFLGVAKHDVAISVGQFTQNQGKFVLTGASKDALKSMPEFNDATVGWSAKKQVLGQKGVDKNTEYRRRRYLSADELGRLVTALAAYPVGCTI